MRRLGIGKKLAYGSGAMAFAAKDAAFINFVVFFYTQVVGVSGTIAGLAATIALLSDAINDPIIGSLTDNHRSPRWGRRHPFMAAAAIPTALCFVFLFMPPESLGQLGSFAWLTFWAVALRTFLTVFHIPHIALGAELEDDYEERSIIVGYRTLMGWLAGLALPALAFALIFAAPEAGSDGRLVAGNYITYGIFSAIVAFAAMAFSTIQTRSEIPHLPKGPEQPEPFSFVTPYLEMRDALRNKNFRWMILSILASGASVGVGITLGLYVNTYFWEFSSAQLAGFMLPMGAASLVAFVLLRPLSERFEKKSLFVSSVVILMLNGLWWIPLRLIDVLPPNGSTTLYGLALFNSFILVVGVFLAQVLGQSMVADIVDEHELETGERREGVFFAALGFTGKAVTGVGTLIGGVVIDLVGIPSGAQPGEVPAEAVFNLGLIAGPILAVTYLLPGFCLLKIKLSRAGYHDIRRALEERENQPTS